MQVANRSRGEEVNGVRLYGLDAEVHRNMENKRDREFEKQLAQWVPPPHERRAKAKTFYFYLYFGLYFY
jgi:hypothetical protein